MNRIKFTPRPAKINTATSLRLTRTFVETGDERCPMAGIWLRLAETDAIADEPPITMPAMRKLFCWRAFHFGLTTLR